MLLARKEALIPKNIDRFRESLKALISRGDDLHNSMQYSSRKEEFVERLQKIIPDKGEQEAFLKALPDFHELYEPWYSEALVVVRQLLPDRTSNFISFYEKPKARKSIQYGNYVIQDYLQHLTTSDHWGNVAVGMSAALPQFRQQLAILKAVRARFDSSLFEIRQLVQADIFDSEIDAARELLKNRFVRAAGAMVGVVLERHLRQVCDDHAVEVRSKHPTISTLNDLLKENSVIDVPQWRHISLLSDIRNLCDHSKTTEPTFEQVTDLLEGTNKVLKAVA